MKPIHKFNGGNGATLCHGCRVIISTGMTSDVLCSECDELYVSLSQTFDSRDRVLKAVQDIRQKEVDEVLKQRAEGYMNLKKKK